MQYLPTDKAQLLQEKIDNGEVCIYEYNRTHTLFCAETGEMRDLSCKSWRCPKHRGKWKHRWYTVVHQELKNYPVDKLLTLTCASEATPHQLCVARQLFFRAVRAKYGSFEYLSVLEFTSKTRLPHLHILARGRYIRQKFISHMWEKATVGSGIRASPVVYISKPKNQDFAAFYALSYALSGVEKGQDLPMDWKGRKITYSAGFFHKSTSELWKEYIVETFGEDTGDTFEVINYAGAVLQLREEKLGF